MAVVNTEMDLWVPQNPGKFLSSCVRVAASQEGLSSMKLVS
jgi:hypothetical protein